jgi:hypothetical protein
LSERRLDAPDAMEETGESAGSDPKVLLDRAIAHALRAPVKRRPGSDRTPGDRDEARDFDGDPLGTGF